MPLLAFQTNGGGPTPTPPPQPSVDLSGLGRAFVDAIQNGMPALLGAVGKALGDQVNGAIQTGWDAIWRSSGNVVTRTPPELTVGFGPIAKWMDDAQAAAYGIILFAVVLLALRTYLAAIIPTHADTLGELIYGIATAMTLAAAFPIVIPRAIVLLNLVLEQVGKVDLTAMLRGVGPPNSIVEAVLLLFVLWFGARFVFKSIKRIVMLAVLLPLGPIAMLLRAIPQTRWLSGWWCHRFGGLLIAQIPATMALTIGVQMAVMSGGLGGMVWSIGFLAAAGDLLDLFGHGLAGTGGPGFLAAAGLGLRLGAMLSGGGAAAAAASSAADPLETTHSEAERYGYA